MKITLANLKTVVKEIQTELTKKIPDLNAGGCGEFAYIFYQHMHNLYPNIIIVARMFDGEDEEFLCAKNIVDQVIKNNGDKKFIEDNSSQLKDASANHIAIKVNDWIFDGQENDTKEFQYNYTPEELKVALQLAGWNDAYDRSNNKVIDGVIITALKKIGITNEQPVEGVA